MLSLSPLTAIRVTHDRTVEYVTPLPGGATHHIRVILSLPTPRLLTFSYSPQGEIEPLSHFLDELLFYVRDAEDRLASPHFPLS